MTHTLKLLCATAATLLATAAQAAVLTLSPANVGAYAGQTTGWGFSLFNDSTSGYLLVTGTDFAPGAPSAFGSYADLLGPRADWLVLAPMATWAEAYDAGLRTGLGEFSLAPSAAGPLSGQVWLHYALFSVDPTTAGFDPDRDTIRVDASIAALATVTAVPEPGSWALLLAGLLALRARRRA
ncbi:PEP-CTERM sorting domain-containing protein [Roseateles sp. BYS96W]|uniref:PEP-CTERM sorting domain-containing protein n=1 Tax=Pelomonas nitida TaxID=3299027 RepID=A0ABW7GC76_9BURK